MSIVLTGYVFCVPVLAEISGEWNRCAGKNTTLDQQIDGCTVVIRSGGETPERLVQAFMSRGFAYMTKGDYDLAIQDYDQAIRLDPLNALALNNRGFAYGQKRNSSLRSKTTIPRSASIPTQP